MKNIKKFLIVILAIIAMFSFSMFFACDCGGDDTGSGNPNTPSNPSNPDNPDDPGTNPDDPGTNPDDPGTNPDDPGTNPDDPGTNPDQPGKDPNDNTTFKVIYFENSTIDVVVGEEKYITVRKGDVSSNLTVKYSSSNESVVSVDKLGKITANAKGSAIITAQVNDFKAKCTVNVTHGNYKPSLVIDNLANNTFVVPANTTYGFNPYVLFNGKVFNNATLTVEAGEGISASVVEKNGLAFVDVTAGAVKGNYDLTVKASWDGVSNIPALTKTINVKVIGEVKLYVTDLLGLNSISNVTIYNSAVETLNGLTSKNADFKVVAENTTAIPTVEIADNSIATYNATTNQIEGTGKLGSTTATVSVTNNDGEVFSLVIPIECKRAVGDYMNSEKTDYY
ncbi:MAG: Ig-like domain-containing protein, partial [Clostridia bacterium]|nr:Ig-like domain-containing protein [Clostridia bacterium]